MYFGLQNVKEKYKCFTVPFLNENIQQYFNNTKYQDRICILFNIKQLLQKIFDFTVFFKMNATLEIRG